jgi:hypothetical protein
MEKGSGTVKIFATTMTQEARKEGKGGEWKRAKVHGAGQGAGRSVQESTAQTSQLGLIATRPGCLTSRPPAGE